MSQKFFKGDHVFIGDMPNYMSHFPNNCEAIVLGSYAELCGGEEPHHYKSYDVYLIERGGTSAWYEEDQFKLLGWNRFDLLPEKHIERINWENKKAREQ